jgi:hypothetical protein
MEEVDLSVLYLLKKYLEEMSQVFQTNHAPLFEPEEFEPEMVRPVQVDTPRLFSIISLIGD